MGPHPLHPVRQVHGRLPARRHPQQVLLPDALSGAPEGFECLDAKHPDWKGEKFVIQVSPDDCTGCTLCSDVCPAKSKTDPTHKALTMVPNEKIHDKEEANWDFFMSLPDVDRTKVKTDNIRSMQVLRPLFEFSGACASPA